ncbi:MAG TPA: phosphoadenylyl-sulfate reductase [Caulobacteraceae bacterium]|jgi:phosphoadenylyl-sulfate reductase (thioredoxin)|nr:phosphoadenylyl-sulfate reductase [Caulobacteraceae bacterium]
MRWLDPGATAPWAAFSIDGVEAALNETPRREIRVRVAPEADVEALWPRLNLIGRIAVAFSGFKDGRGFSLGQMLRERGFAGELVAAGELIPDHAPMLARCGFDAVDLPLGAAQTDWTRALESFSAAYQPAADGASTVWAQRDAARRAAEAATLAAELNAQYRDASAKEIVRAAMSRFPGRVAVLSSFGTEAAVGLHVVASVDRTTPVLFLDTDRHFVPTLEYRDRLTRHLGLTDLRNLEPKNAAERDARGDLWRTDPDACCALRKVEPLAAVSPQFDVLITGRKRFHGGSRLRLPVFEAVGAQIRVNPLANWSAEAIEAHFEAYGLPRHPLTQGGYRSVGCWPCTQPSSDEENVRAGRWKGLAKSECGIHMPDRWVAAAERRAS